MACFLVPSALAVVTTSFRKRIPTKYHIGWLNTMLWGGSLALAVEHISQQELVAQPPFLTALNSAAGTAAMLSELATTGTAILIVSVAAWATMVAVYNRFTLESAEKISIEHT